MFCNDRVQQHVRSTGFSRRRNRKLTRASFRLKPVLQTSLIARLQSPYRLVLSDQSNNLQAARENLNGVTCV